MLSFQSIAPRNVSISLQCFHQSPNLHMESSLPRINARTMQSFIKTADWTAKEEKAWNHGERCFISHPIVSRWCNIYWVHLHLHSEVGSRAVQSEDQSDFPSMCNAAWPSLAYGGADLCLQTKRIVLKGVQFLGQFLTSMVCGGRVKEQVQEHGFK